VNNLHDPVAMPVLPLHEQEYYELRLDDLGFPFRPQFIDGLGIVARYRFIVREAHVHGRRLTGRLPGRDMRMKLVGHPRLWVN